MYTCTSDPPEKKKRESNWLSSCQDGDGYGSGRRVFIFIM